MLVVLMPVSVTAQVMMLPTDTITVAAAAIDTLGYDQTPDTAVVNVYKNGVLMFSNAFTVLNAQITIDGGMYIFTDAFEDIDGAGGDGFYVVKVRFIKVQGLRNSTMWQTLYVIVGRETRFIATGFSVHDAAAVLTAFLAGSTEDNFKADVTNLDVATSTLSTHDAADVYAEFISGANEDIFKSDSAWIKAAILAYADTLGALPEGGFGMLMINGYGAGVDTIHVYYNDVIVGDYELYYNVSTPESPDSIRFVPAP